MKQEFEDIKYISKLINDKYYENLIRIRNEISIACDSFFQAKKGQKVDLFLIAQSISSPTAKGSDSKPIEIKIKNQNFFLIDSAQFGMEPLVQGKIDLVYCYLPSFRGELADKRHLNQFYHCEAEMKGELNDTIKLVNELIYFLLKKVLLDHKNKKIIIPEKNFKRISEIIKKDIPVVSFDHVFEILQKMPNNKKLVKKTKYRRTITSIGEEVVSKILFNHEKIFWIVNYDRDMVAFYQKPDPLNKNKALNADLIFPKLFKGFCGEVAGAGQRQDNKKELIESMKRQKIDGAKNYKWYLQLREIKNYKKTTGFGIGIERVIAWILDKENIADSAIYPVILTSKKVISKSPKRDRR